MDSLGTVIPKHSTYMAYLPWGVEMVCSFLFMLSVTCPRLRVGDRPMPRSCRFSYAQVPHVPVWPIRSGGPSWFTDTCRETLRLASNAVYISEGLLGRDDQGVGQETSYGN